MYDILMILVDFCRNFGWFWLNFATRISFMKRIQLTKMKRIRNTGYNLSWNQLCTRKRVLYNLGIIKAFPTGWPVIHGRVFLVPSKPWLVQCTLLYTLYSIEHFFTFNKVPEQHGLSGVSTGWPVIHGRVFLVPCKPWLVHCPVYATLHCTVSNTFSLLTRYQNNTVMFIWCF